MARILVTGSAGFIGRHVVARLQERGHVVQGVDCFLPQVHGTAFMVQPWEWCSTVGNAAAQWTTDPHQCYDAVVHLAAHVGVGQSACAPADYVDANVGETARLWEAIIKRRTEIRKVVVASSMACYGEGLYAANLPDGRTLLYDDAIRDVTAGWDALRPQAPDGATWKPVSTREWKRPRPISIYAQTKYDAERYSLLLGDAYGVPTVALRFFNVVGVGQAPSNPYTGCVMNFLARVVNGKPPLVYEDGAQTRDFVAVDDVADAVVAALEADGLCGAFNVCTGVATKVGDLAARLCALGRAAGLPATEPEITKQYRVGDVRHCVGDPAAFAAATGWRAKRELDDVLRDVVGWVATEPGHVVDRVPEAVRELVERGLVR